MDELHMHFPDKFGYKGSGLVEDPFKPHAERCTCASGHALLCPAHAEEAMVLLTSLGGGDS